MNNEFEYAGRLELAGQERDILALCESDEGGVWVKKVEMARLERVGYRPDGSFYPHVVRHVTDITALLDDRQLAALELDILAWANRQRAEDRVGEAA